MKLSRQTSGSVLVIVLWIMVILIVITATLAQRSRLSSRISQSYGRRCICRWAVRAAVETAISVLDNDDTSYDAFDELWHDDPEDFNDIQLEGCVFSVEITDESSKLNVNTVDKKYFLHLLEMTPEQADSIVDWRDKDSKLQPEGAEVQYYNTLQYRYPIRNAPFQTVREVLWVKGMQEKDFYGEDYNLNDKLDANEKDGEQSFPADNQDAVLEKGIGTFLTCYSFCKNVDAQGNERINIQDADMTKLQQELGLSKPHAKWVEERKGKLKSIADLIDRNSPKNKSKQNEKGDNAAPIDMETFKEIADRITISKEETLQGRVNINTAPREVLVALLEGDEPLADAVISFRDTLETPMTSIGRLLDVKTMTVEKFKKIAGMITVRSDVFSLNARAVDDTTGLTYTATAVVTRNSDSSNIIYWHEGIAH